MLSLSTQWSLGVLVGLPIFSLIILLIIGWIVVCFLSDEVGIAVVSIVVLLALIGLLVSPLGYYPFKAEYHQWRDRNGIVAEVNKRLVSNGDKGMSEKIVVRYKDSDGAYGCEDTRCALVKQGDTLDLKCKRAWQYASVSGYDCRFVSRRSA